mmetsp:Transcript_31976/g.70459  ORF Transcript_31976/g.70459 Transcript_31976/m.70459 type:complete len:119 (-) Transcript_31976:72-428(-)
MVVSTSDVTEFVLGLLLCSLILAYAGGSARHVSFICSTTIAGTFFYSRISPFFDSKMEIFSVLLAILVMCAAMVGGVLAVLLPKISVGMSLGFSAALWLCSVLTNVLYFLNSSTLPTP